MGLMDKFLEVILYKNNNNSIETEDDNDEYLDNDEETSIKSSSKIPHIGDRDRKNYIKPVSVKPNKKGGQGSVCVIRPTSMEDGKEITDTLLSDKTVILNLEGLDPNIAQRITDYTSGSCYAIDGTLQKISQSILVITPQSIKVSGDLEAVFDMDMIDLPTIQKKEF